LKGDYYNKKKVRNAEAQFSKLLKDAMASSNKKEQK
jgi:hypothetical protein